MTMAETIDWDAIRRRLADSQRALDAGFAFEGDRLQALLRERSDILATPGTQSRRAAATDRVLAIRVGEERYGLDLKRLAGVLTYGNCTPAPRAPRPLLGLMTARGDIWAVYDFGRLLDVADDASDAGYVVLLRHGSRRIGLRVHGLERVHVLAREDIRPATGGSAASAAGLVTGMTPDGLIIIDMTALWAHREIGEAVSHGD
jgi:purine-binding chemotaxis protein CheW